MAPRGIFEELNRKVGLTILMLPVAKRLLDHRFLMFHRTTHSVILIWNWLIQSFWTEISKWWIFLRPKAGRKYIFIIIWKINGKSRTEKWNQVETKKMMVTLRSFGARSASIFCVAKTLKLGVLKRKTLTTVLILSSPRSLQWLTVSLKKLRVLLNFRRGSHPYRS